MSSGVRCNGCEQARSLKNYPHVCEESGTVSIAAGQHRLDAIISCVDTYPNWCSTRTFMQDPRRRNFNPLHGLLVDCDDPTKIGLDFEIRVCIMNPIIVPFVLPFLIAGANNVRGGALKVLAWEQVIDAESLVNLCFSFRSVLFVLHASLDLSCSWVRSVCAGAYSRNWNISNLLWKN